MKGLVIAGALALIACKGDRPPPEGKLTPEASALLAHLPSDAKLLVGVNLTRARGTPIYDTLSGRAAAALPPALANLKAMCGLDVLGAIDRALFSVGDQLAERRDVHVVVTGSFSKQMIGKCVAALSSKDAPMTASEDGKLTVYAAPEGRAFVYWPAPDTVVLSGDPVDSADRLNAVIAGGGATRSPAARAATARVDTGAALWAAGPLPEAIRRRAGDAKIEAFYAQVNPAGDGLEGTLGFQLASADLAESTALGLREEKGDVARDLGDPKLSKIIERVEVTQAGADVVLRVKLSGDEVEHLLGLASMFAP